MTYRIEVYSMGGWHVWYRGVLSPDELQTEIRRAEKCFGTYRVSPEKEEPE